MNKKLLTVLSHLVFANKYGIDTTPPKAAQESAKKVLRWKEEHSDEIKGMTRVGWTRARQLASGKPLSFDVIKRMASFKRHQKNADIPKDIKHTPWKDAGYVAWEGWGGDTGIDWAIRKSEEIDRKKKEN